MVYDITRPDNDFFEMVDTVSAWDQAEWLKFLARGDVVPDPNNKSQFLKAEPGSNDDKEKFLRDNGYSYAQYICKTVEPVELGGIHMIPKCMWSNTKTLLKSRMDKKQLFELVVVDGDRTEAKFTAANATIADLKQKAGQLAKALQDKKAAEDALKKNPNADAVAEAEKKVKDMEAKLKKAHLPMSPSNKVKLQAEMKRMEPYIKCMNHKDKWGAQSLLLDTYLICAVALGDATVDVVKDITDKFIQSVLDSGAWDHDIETCADPENCAPVKSGFTPADTEPWFREIASLFSTVGQATPPPSSNPFAGLWQKIRGGMTASGTAIGVAASAAFDKVKAAGTWTVQAVTPTSTPGWNPLGYLGTSAQVYSAVGTYGFNNLKGWKKWVFGVPSLLVTIPVGIVSALVMAPIDLVSKLFTTESFTTKYHASLFGGKTT